MGMFTLLAKGLATQDEASPNWHLRITFGKTIKHE
jgi:hypothetical protein